MCWLLTFGALGARGVATVVRGGDVATVALMTLGFVFVVFGLTGRVPLRLRYKDGEIDMRRRVVTGLATVANELHEAAATTEDEDAARALEAQSERVYGLAVSTALDSTVQAHSFDQVIRSRRLSQEQAAAILGGSTVRRSDANVIETMP